MTMTDDNSEEIPSFDTLPHPDGHWVAYRKKEGKGPGILFCGGFMSNMFGTKAAALEKFCANYDLPYVRFDYLGHGVSGGLFETGNIGRWTSDALLVLDRLTAGPQIIIGSSMGGWIMLHLALKRPERIKGLIGIAAAPDFTEDLFDKELSPADRKRLETEEVIDWLSPYGVDYRISRTLFEDGKNQLLFPEAPWPINVPVTLLHGMADPVVPWETSAKIAENLSSQQVTVKLIKDGDHSLSRPEDLSRLFGAVHGLLA